jgi:RNA polymerase-associated protein CTR9
MHQANEAHDLLKDSLASQSSNLNLRAYYTYFLIQSNASRPAREFVFGTLRDHDKHDLYALCAAGWLHYHQARESRDTSPKGVEERRVFFRRSAEFYEKALGLDPFCAIAAQGLAIVTAEDALGTMGGALPPGPAPDEGQRRVMNARDALEVFAKVRESTSDGSVYVNMGHCYFARDEYDRAIESVRAFCSIDVVKLTPNSMRRRRSATTVGAISRCCCV